MMARHLVVAAALVVGLASGQYGPIAGGTKHRTTTTTEASEAANEILPPSPYQPPPGYQSPEEHQKPQLPGQQPQQPQLPGQQPQQPQLPGQQPQQAQLPGQQPQQPQLPGQQPQQPLLPGQQQQQPQLPGQQPQQPQLPGQQSQQPQPHGSPYTPTGQQSPSPYQPSPPTSQQLIPQPGQQPFQPGQQPQGNPSTLQQVPQSVLNYQGFKSPRGPQPPKNPSQFWWSNPQTNPFKAGLRPPSAASLPPYRAPQAPPVCSSALGPQDKPGYPPQPSQPIKITPGIPIPPQNKPNPINPDNPFLQSSLQNPIRLKGQQPQGPSSAYGLPSQPSAPQLPGQPQSYQPQQPSPYQPQPQANLPRPYQPQPSQPPSPYQPQPSQQQPSQPQPYQPQPQQPSSYQPQPTQPQTYQPQQPQGSQPQTYQPQPQQPSPYKPQTSPYQPSPSPYQPQSPQSGPGTPPGYGPQALAGCSGQDLFCVPASLCYNGIVSQAAGNPTKRGPCSPGEVCCKTKKPIPVGPGFLTPPLPSPKPNYVTEGPALKYTGPLNTTPPKECAAALKCVDISFCTVEGVMSDSPVALTREQIENRVPLSDCQDESTGAIGKCCRDPNYKDPWPGGMMMPMPKTPSTGDDGQYRPDTPEAFDDGSYHPDGQGPTTSVNPYTIKKPLGVFNQEVTPFPAPKPGQTHSEVFPKNEDKAFGKPQPNYQPQQQPAYPQPNYQPSPSTQQQTPYQSQGQPQSTYPQSPQPNQPQFPVTPSQPGTSPYQPQGQPQTTYQPQGQPQTTYQPQGQPQTPYQPQSQPQTTYQPQGQPQTTYQPQGQPQTTYQPQGQPQTSYQPQGQPQTTYQPQGQPQTTYQPQGQPQTTYQPQGQPQTSYQPQGQPQTTYQPQGQPQTTYQPQGQPQPTYQPQGQPQTTYQPQGQSQTTYQQSPEVTQPQTSVTPKTSPPQETPSQPSQQSTDQTTQPESDSLSTPVQPQSSPVPEGECGVKRNSQGSQPDESGFGEFPWHALILSKTNNTPLCSAVIIAPNAVLTAAHCIDGLDAEDLTIEAGRFKLGSNNNGPRPPQSRRVGAAAIHPNYDSGSLVRDEAVLVSQEPLVFDEHIDKICLAASGTEAYQPTGSACYVTGFGRPALQINAGGTPLHKVRVELLGKEECEERLKKTHLGKFFILNKGFTCALPPKESELCKVDVGSPLSCERADGKFELAGVYSWDTKCSTELPGVTASCDTDWINQVLSTPLEQLRQQSKRPKFQATLVITDISSKPGFALGYGK